MLPQTIRNICDDTLLAHTIDGIFFVADVHTKQLKSHTTYHLFSCVYYYTRSIVTALVTLKLLDNMTLNIKE